jgi:capsular exopolysaccharide synthesis family protein
MSKIFDVVKKDNIIDFGDLYQAEVNNGNEPQLISELAASFSGPSSVRQGASRVIRLCLSAFSPIFPFDQGDDIAAEQYRMIRTKILHNSKKAQLIVVSSACSGDGKTVTSINIAASLALKDDSCVLLVDSDLRRPRVAEALNIPASPGLAEILTGQADLETALIRPEQFPNLAILPAGTAGESAAELLDSERWRQFIQQARTRFTHVLFDAPPIAAVTDYDLIQLVCDAAIVVIRPDHSNRSAYLKALGTIPPEKMLGVVLNCVEDWWLWKVPVYGYGYYQKSVSEDKPGSKQDQGA